MNIRENGLYFRKVEQVTELQYNLFSYTSQGKVLISGPVKLIILRLPDMRST